MSEHVETVQDPGEATVTVAVPMPDGTVQSVTGKADMLERLAKEMDQRGISYVRGAVLDAKGVERAKEMDKLLKTLRTYDPEIIQELESMDSAALKKRVLDSQQNLLASERRRKNDAVLDEANKEFKRLRAPYDDTRKFQGAIINYGVILLEGRGEPLGDANEEETTP